MSESATSADRPTRGWRLPLFESTRPLNRAALVANLTAGVSLAALNIPQAMGYAKIAGMPVITGLYTLLLPVVAFAAFGSSRYLVVASDSATAAILAGGLSGLASAGNANYIAFAGLVALLTAGLLLLARILKLGFLADFLSRTVLIGFLTGVGFQVGIAVLSEMLGVEVHGNNPVNQLLQILGQLPNSHIPTLCLSTGVTIFVLVLHRFAPRFPGALIAVVGTIAASALFDFSGHGIGVVGAVAGGLPHLSVPAMNWALINQLLPVAGSCFLMILAQSAVTARAYAAKHHQMLDENRDLLGLSAANAAAAFSGTFVVNGSPTQTAMVETSGGSSQVAHLSTALVVMLVLLFLTGPLQFLPVCVLGAVVFTIAVRLVDLKGLRELRRKSPGEWTLALATTASVVLLGVEDGIMLALVLSLLQHVRHSYRPHTAVETRAPEGHWLMNPLSPEHMAAPGLIVYWFGSDLFYANFDRFAGQAHKLVTDPQSPVTWLVVDAGAITSIDYTAGSGLKELAKELGKKGVTLVFAHINENFRADLDRQELTEVIGPTRMFETLRECLAAYPGRAGSD
ncbi:MAG TPA: SulP family inorganic anion transporter [Chthoniobacterales bacterium]